MTRRAGRNDREDERMSREYLAPKGLGAPIEPYGHAIRCGNTLYLAGQVAFDEKNEIVGLGDPRAQAERCWKNIELAVKAAGGTIDNVVKIVIFLKDIRHAAHEVEIRGRLFKKGRYPVCTMVQVANLGLDGLLIEIDATAVLD
jgi:enamine deaminase RidA (YjgF/YER057c/UK114 family)